MADMQDGMSQGIAGDLQSALTGWSNIVATAVVTSAGEIQLASREFSLQSPSLYLLIADAILFIHVLFVAFVVFGLLLVFLGGALGWLGAQFVHQP